MRIITPSAARCRTMQTDADRCRPMRPLRGRVCLPCRFAVVSTAERVSTSAAPITIHHKPPVDRSGLQWGYFAVLYCKRSNGRTKIPSL